MTELAITDLSVHAGRKALLDGVSLSLRPGEFKALVGPNGAGKTTLLRAALGLRAYAGSVTIDGRQTRDFSGRERAGKLAWLPQQALISEAVTALEFVAAARFRFAESRASSLAAARDALARVGAADFAERNVLTLSGGEQQRVACAALLAQDAPLLLLDEPANHLDPGQQIALYRLFGELWREGRGILCVTHDVNLLAHVGEGPVGVIGLADGRARFETTFDAPDLPERLGDLFGLPFTAVQAAGRRALLAGGTP